MRLLVFLPCLNEEQTLASVISLIPRQIPGVSQVDVLVVDDGSSDHSADVARKSGAKVISHKRNLGVGRSFQSALSHAISEGYQFMVNIDADGQFDPNAIPFLLKPILDDEADFVSGSRFLSGKDIPNMSGVKKWGNARMTQLITRLADCSFTDVSCGFRAYSREAMLRLNLQGQFTYTQETFLNLAFQDIRMKELAIEVKYFADRKSRVAASILKYAVNTVKIIFRTYRDYHPLKFFASIALIFFLVGSGFLGFLFGWYFVHHQFSPHIWAGFVGAAFLFTSQILFCLGLLADMLVRVRKNQETLLYLVKKGST